MHGKEIPQIVAIVHVSREGIISLKKAVRQHLGIENAQTLYLDLRDEVLLSAKPSTGQETPLMKGNRIRLPEEVLGKLDVAVGGLVGLVQRENAVSVKKVGIVEKEGGIASLDRG